MNREAQQGSEFFEKWVMGFIRVVAVVVLGAVVGHTSALTLLERFWPAYPPSLLLVGAVAGIGLMYLAYRALKRWDDILSFLSR